MSLIHRGNTRPLALLGMLLVVVLLMGGISNSYTGKECPAMSKEKLTLLGDVKPSYMVRDEYGVYCHVEAELTDEAIGFSESKVDFISAEQAGFAREDVLTAIDNTAFRLVDSFLDSTRFDSYLVSSSEWLEQNRSFMTQEYFVILQEKINSRESLVNSGITITDIFPAPLNRNRTPRAVTTLINLERVTVFTSLAGEETLAIEFSATSTFFASNATILKVMMENSNVPQKSLRLNPNLKDLFDGVDDSYMVLNVSYILGYSNGDYEKINGSRGHVIVSTTHR